MLGISSNGRAAMVALNRAKAAIEFNMIDRILRVNAGAVSRSRRTVVGDGPAVATGREEV